MGLRMLVLSGLVAAAAGVAQAQTPVPTMAAPLSVPATAVAPETLSPAWLLDLATGRIIHGGAIYDAPAYHRTQVSLAGWRRWPVGPRGRLRLSAGLRLTHGWAPAVELRRQDVKRYGRKAALAYRTYTSDNPGWLTIQDLELTALNLAAGVQWRPVRWLRLGFNIDVAGVPLYSSHGRAELSYPATPADTILPAFDGSRRRPAGDARVRRGNLLLGDRFDRGYLNSEFYVGIPVGQLAAVRVGLSHIVTNYVAEGRRYQVFQNLGFIGFTCKLPR